MSQVEAQEAKVVEEMVKGMLMQKAQKEKATKREQSPLKTTLDEVRGITTPIRVMLNAITIISMGIIQVNARRNRVISQRKMLMWLMWTWEMKTIPQPSSCITLVKKEALRYGT